HNIEADLGKHTFSLGMNEYKDLTQHEYAALNGYKMAKSSVGSSFLEPENLQVPKTVDWREKGYVTPVKNQVQSGVFLRFSHNRLWVRRHPPWR
ncbi:hypothetical protein CAPTEDRAFT_122483, partial [Capitella teleta]